ncbi:Gfo/Idh/MocA family oxidoreductase [Streptomyces sp. XM4193]|uniref:Gfo/Idh/MocA family protein n=1 Tax=Streptomyces sp. XM4193 TaxID=2929782 RepID=UPI001FFA711C|nr:Gfo/Idh/MocA family oxidoreductase [Streptomyces sp. XM4193]MCK1798962.1 Gfo/Idh/MocA family oxidoreductase [Streptomyces sp. XM4193]
MRIGVIGLGDIARKAYLPVLTAQPGLQPRLFTRTPAVLQEVGETYRIPREHRHADLDSLLESGLDAAFVHASTEAHPELVTGLLEAGVPTFVDKPLAYSLAESERLVRLAQSRSLPLTVGFNRRHAPGYAQCLDHARDLIVLQKHRVSLPEDPRTMVFDDFIHVVDTLLFLAPGAHDRVDVHARQVDGLLHHVVLQLSGEGFTALGIMNRLSGSAEEVLEVSGQDTKREVRNLAEIVDHKGQPSVRRRGDWEPVARQRGIEQCVLAFLDEVRRGGPGNAAEALETHRLCEQIVAGVLLDAS